MSFGFETQDWSASFDIARRVPAGGVRLAQILHVDGNDLDILGLLRLRFEVAG